MRAVGTLVEAIVGFHAGMKDPPDKLSVEDLQEVLSTTRQQDDVTAVKYLTAIYARKTRGALLETLNIQEPFQYLNKLLWLNHYMLYDAALKGERHAKVWANDHSRKLQSNFDGVEELKALSNAQRLGLFSAIQDDLVRHKERMFAFTIPEALMMSSITHSLIKVAKDSLSG